MVVVPYLAACYVFSLFFIFAPELRTSKFHGRALLTLFYTLAQFIDGLAFAATIAINKIFLSSMQWAIGIWEIRFLLHWMKAAS